MTDSKKRIEEIINKCIKNCLYRKNVSPKNYEIYENENIDQATTKILKEFVHKDNLPSVGKIKKFLNKFREEYGFEPERDDELIPAIRKLIEGKK